MKPGNLSIQNNITEDQLIQMLRQPASLDKGFRLLMQKYQERLYWQIRKLVIEHEDANDVLQNSLIKCYRNIGSFQAKSKLYTWLSRIAINEAITHINKKKRRMASSLDNEDLQLANTLEADAHFDEEEAQLRLHQALQQLPDKQHQVFCLRYFEEKSYKEISEHLQTSVGALKASYHHAVKKIEAYLKEGSW